MFREKAAQSAVSESFQDLHDMLDLARDDLRAKLPILEYRFLEGQRQQDSQSVRPV
jgi:UTP:GlnB (protein PII) uridylyltransferase